MKSAILSVLLLWIFSYIRMEPVPEMIPGIDHLAAGFDASKMVDGIKLAKQRIFDLSEEGPLYSLKSNGRSTTFRTSLLAEVADVSLRTENYCESIVATFEQFYKYYFQSISIDIGVNLKNILAGIGYSRILEEVYNVTNKSEQSIGIASTWWGLYSMQLPPAFLIPFTNTFTLSLKRLAAIGVPSTNNDQNKYNDVIKSYGTHYVSSVIVGGTASTYTFLNNSYTSKTSYRKQEEQVRIGVEVNQLKLSGNMRWISLEESLTEDFKKNSRSTTIFHPTVEIEEKESPWNAWLEKASQQPVVVNQTISRISNLASDYPVVQEHLEKTINFYEQTGEYPKTVF